MWQPKRVWSNKKTVWDGKKSVWLEDWELKTYDGHWEDAGSDLQTYWNQWENVSWNAILDVYDSNTPEPIWTAEDWIKATYTFKDYDGTVLKTGTVDDWWTPVAPADPTREATAQYTYTFAGWSPSVWPIAKNTVYTATYTATVNNYTVSIASNDSNYWTVDESSVEVPYGTAISVDGNTLTIGTGEDAVVVTATAESGYEFSSWWEVPATVTGNLSITATFVVSVSITINDVLSDTTGTVGSTVTVYFTKTGTAWLLYSDDPDILTVESSDDTGGEWFTNSVTLNVTGAGTTTLTITANAGGGVTASDTIEIVCSAPAYSFTNKARIVPYTPTEEESGEWLEEGKYYLFCGGTDAPDLTSWNYIMLQRNWVGGSRIIEKHGIFADSKYELPNDWGNAWEAIIDCDGTNNFYDYGMYLLNEASGWAIGTAKWEFVTDFWPNLEAVYGAINQSQLDTYVSLAIQTEKDSAETQDPLVTSITSDYDPDAE